MYRSMRNIAHNDIIKDAMAMGKRDNDMPVVFFDIIRDITSKLDSQVAIGLILKAGRDLTKADFCNIALIKNNKMHIYPQVEGMGTYNIDEGIMGYVVATGRPRLVGDVKRDEYYKMCNETTISELAVPIKYNSKCIGVLNVESSKENAFNKSDRDVLMAMADFAASAINNARHHEELKILREIDQKITSSLDLIETLSLIRDKASELINTNDIRIRLLEGSKLIPVVGVEQSQISAATWEIGECIAGKAAEDREPKLEKDVQNNPYFKKALSKIQDKKRKDDLLKINSEIAVPLLIKSEVIGVLNAHSPRKSAFDEDDCRLLRALADQASIAIENARLYKDLEKQIEILEELNKIGTHIINLDFEKVFRGITKGLHEIIKVDIPMIYLLNDDKDKFNIVYGDIRKDWESECHPRPNGAGARALNERQTIIEMDDINPFPKQKGVKTTIAIPLLAWNQEKQNDRKIAVMYLHFLGKTRVMNDSQNDEMKRLKEEITNIIKSETMRDSVDENQLEIVRDSIAKKFDEENINKRIHDTLGADIILIYAFNEQINGFGKLCFSSLGMGWKDNNNPRRENGSGQKAMKTKKPYIAYEEDTLIGINPIPKEKGVKTTVAVPLIFNDRVLGVMYLHFLAKKRIFSKEEMKAIETFGANAAIAIEKTKSCEDLKKLYEIGKVMTSKIKLYDVIAEVRANSIIIEPNSSLEICLYDHKTNAFNYISANENELPTFKLDEIIEKKFIIINNLDTLGIKIDSGIKTIAAVALEVENKIIGILYFYFNDIKAFSHEEALRLSMFAGKVAIAINNALKYAALDKINEEIDQLRGSDEINEELDIIPINFKLLDFIRMIRVSGTSTELMKDLNYIFQKIFWSFEKIGLAPLTPGFGGAGVLMITPDNQLATARCVVAKIGPINDIIEEVKNYNKYVKWFIGGMRSTNLMASAYSDPLGGIVYSLIGNPMRPGRYFSFGDYYKNKYIVSIEGCIEKLL